MVSCRTSGRRTSRVRVKGRLRRPTATRRWTCTSWRSCTTREDSTSSVRFKQTARVLHMIRLHPRLSDGRKPSPTRHGDTTEASLLEVSSSSFFVECHIQHENVFLQSSILASFAIAIILIALRELIRNTRSSTIFLL